MSLPQLKRLYRVSKSLKTPDIAHLPDGQIQVTGIASFICLALELDMELFSDPFNAYVYPSRAGHGGTFSVSQFGLQFDDLGFKEEDVYRDGQMRRGGWLSKGSKIVTKHIWAGSIDHPDTSLDDTAALRPLVQELRVLAHAPLRDHKNIIDIFGVSWEPRLDFFGRCWPALVLEYAHCGNLAEFFTLPDIDFDWEIKVKLTADIVEGLSALQGCGVIHGDLKSENVLVAIDSDGKFVAKLIDFGFAIIEADYPDSHLVSVQGFTPEWMAPEARAGTLQLKRAFLLDIYSFGLVFAFLLLDGLYPLSIKGRHLTLKEIYDLQEKDEVGMVVLSNFQLQVYSLAQWTMISNILKSTLVSSPEGRCQDFELIKSHLVADETAESSHGTFTKPESEIPSPDISMMSFQESSNISSNPETGTILPPAFHTATEWAGGIFDTSHESWEVILLPIRVHREVQKDLQRKAERLSTFSDENHKPRWQKESADAAYALFMLSGQGLGGIHDLDAATRWLLVAAKGGCMRARIDLPRVFAAMNRDTPQDIKGHIHEWLEEAILLGEDRFAEDTLELLDPHRLSNAINSRRKIWSLGGFLTGGTLWSENWDEAMTNAWEDYASYSRLPDLPRDENETQQAKWPLVARQAMDDIPNFSVFVRSSPPGTTAIRAVKEYGGGLAWIHLAANLGMTELVKIILEQRGVNIDLQDWDGRTALFFATISGNSAMADFLLDRGAKASAAHDHLGNTCLHFISSFDRCSIPGLAQRLVESGGDVNAQNSKQETPLHATLKNPTSSVSNFISIQALLKCHADPCIPDIDGDKPHLWPAIYQQPECLRLLLSLSQSIPADEFSMLKATVFEALTLQPQLERKAFAGDKYSTSVNETISLLLDEQSVDVFKTLPDNGGDSVLFTALSRGGIDLALAIVHHLPFIDIDEKDPDTKRPVIRYAIRHGQESVFQTLISLEADIFYNDNLGENVFHVAAEYSPEMLPRLFELAKKASRVMEMVDAITIDGATPLDRAIMSGNLEAAKLFIACEADFTQYRLRTQDDTKTNILGYILGLPSTSVDQVSFLLDLSAPAIVATDGSTVFHAIGQVNSTGLNEDPTSLELDSKLRIFEMLLKEFPAAIHQVNSKGETALHRASWGIRIDVVRRLCELGLDPNIRDHDGNTALDHLVRRKLSGVLDTNYLLVKRAFEREVSKVENLLRRDSGQVPKDWIAPDI